MKNRVIIVLREDMTHYPPVLSLIHALLEEKREVVLVGVYSDAEGRKILESKGVKFLLTIDCDGKANPVVKLFEKAKFRKQVLKYLKELDAGDGDTLWLMQDTTICLLHDIVGKYRTVLHFFEFSLGANWKYRMMNPGFDMRRTLLSADRIVCCEYNRAQIMKGYFQLPELPAVLPNKVSIDESVLDSAPDDIRKIVGRVSEKTEGKKVILYQGIFLEGERKLDEFCEAVAGLPDEYVFIAMGKENETYERLKKQYASDRIVFLPFIRPPYHLLVTRKADIGILSYFPRSGSIERTINPLYCAPNKIFEYARFGVPMISNDVPALKYAFLEYHCGECIDYPVSAEAIRRTIRKVFSEYGKYSEGARSFFSSVDVRAIVNQLLGSNE